MFKKHLHVLVVAYAEVHASSGRLKGDALPSVEGNFILLVVVLILLLEILRIIFDCVVINSHDVLSE